MKKQPLVYTLKADLPISVPALYLFHELGILHKFWINSKELPGHTLLYLSVGSWLIFRHFCFGKEM